MTPRKQMTPVFVYGTLKRGFLNYVRYLGVAVASGGARFIGEATTVDALPLTILTTGTNPPIMIERPGVGHRVSGEVFEVDERTLEALDALEGCRPGVPSKYYVGRIRCELVDGAAPDGSSSALPPAARSPSKNACVTCACYFFPADEALLTQPLLCEYREEHHAQYRPNAANPSWVALCRPAPTAPHGLRTSAPCAMRTHVLRLLPGDDLLTELTRFARERELQACVVLSCVGSTGTTTLRPAGAKELRVFEGKFEILSLSGTLSRHGHHLHLSVGDEECRVVGGHMVKGCAVRTTAEIALGEIEGTRFSRPHDTRTGYDELSIDGTVELELETHQGGTQSHASEGASAFIG